MCAFVAAEEGFEPSQTESESAVLPLHNSAIYFLFRKRIYCSTADGICQVFFAKESAECARRLTFRRVGAIIALNIRKDGEAIYAKAAKSHHPRPARVGRRPRGGAAGLHRADSPRGTARPVHRQRRQI